LIRLRPHPHDTDAVTASDAARYAAPRGAEARRAARLARRADSAARAAALQARLTVARETGEAENVHAFWLDALVAARVTPALRAELAARSDVEWVRDNARVRVLRDDARVWASEAHAARTRDDTHTRGDAPASDARARLLHARAPTGPAPAEGVDPTRPQWSPRYRAGIDEVSRIYGLDGRGVRLAVLDTGVEITHPDLAGRMVTRDASDPTFPGGWAEIDNRGEPIPGSQPYDSDGHGTHVSGIAVAGAASGFQIGVAPGVGFMHALVLPGGEGRFAQIIGGMEWAADPDGDPLTDDGADVVSMSFGSGDTLGTLVEPVRALLALGIVPVAAIGNTPSQTVAPASIPDVIGVGASDSLDAVAPFSGRGVLVWNHAPYVGSFSKPDLVAPGVDIWSTVADGTWQWIDDRGNEWSGTSQATPFVAGTAALMLQANANLPPDSVRAILIRTARDIEEAGHDTASGHGRIDGYAAVTAAFSGRPWLLGTMRDATSGAPLPNAVITILPPGITIQSDAAGRFSIRPPDSILTVTFAAFAHDTLTRSLSLPPDVAAPIDVALTPRQTIVVSGRVSDEHTYAGVPATIEVLFGGDVALAATAGPDGAFTLALPLGVNDLRIAPPAPYDTAYVGGLSVTEAGVPDGALAVRLSRREVLVVNATDYPDYAPIYTAALDRAGRRYRMTRDRPDLTTLHAYGKVLWFTGDATVNTFSPLDQIYIADFLNDGGRMLVMGKGVAREFEVQSFLPDVLHARLAANPPTPTGAVGDASSAPFAGLAVQIVPVPGGPAERPSALVPLPPAAPALHYEPGDTAIAAITVVLDSTSQGSRLAFLGFGLEEMPVESEQVDLLTRALDWLEPAPVISHTPLRDTDDDATPFTVSANVRVAAAALDTTEMRVLYALNGGPEIAVPLTRAGDGNLFTAVIPAQPLGTTIDYRLEAKDVGGRIGLLPEAVVNGAPARFTFHVAADTLPPVIVHHPAMQTNNLTGPYVISAQVTDDRALRDVVLRYHWQGDDWISIAMSPDSTGVYAAAVPGPAAAGDTLTYSIVATDASRSANMSTAPSSDAGAYTLRVVRTLAWDLETDDGGFVAGSGDWAWGIPTAEHEGHPIGAHSGARVWATRLAGGYSSPVTATLDLPPVRVPAAARVATLRFWQAYEFDGTPPQLSDGAVVRVSTDGGATYRSIAPAEGYDGIVATSTPGVGGEVAFGGSALTWRQTSVSLTGIRDKEIRLRFQYGSHLGGGGLGWFIDDVTVDWAEVDTLPPVIAHVRTPLATPRTSGTYRVYASLSDGETGIASAVVRYSTDGGRTFAEVPFEDNDALTSAASIPAQPAGTRVVWYAVATDAGTPPNTTRYPGGDSVLTFPVFPASPAVILRAPDAPSGLTVDALQTEIGARADVWDVSRLGLPTAEQLGGYRAIVTDGANGPDAALRSLIDAAAQVAAGDAAGTTRAYDQGVLVCARHPAPDSAAARWLMDRTGVQVLGDIPGPATICGAYSFFPLPVTFTLGTPHAVLAPGVELEPILAECPQSGDSVLAEIQRDSPSTSGVLGVSLVDLPSDVRPQVLDGALPRLRGPARFVLDTPFNTEDTAGPYVVNALVTSPAGIDTSSLVLHLTFTTVSGAREDSVFFQPAPGFDRYAAAIPGQPVGTTIAFTATGRDLAGVPLVGFAPRLAEAFRVVSDSLPPEVYLSQAWSVRPGESGVISITAVDADTRVDSLTFLYQVVGPDSTIGPLVAVPLQPNVFGAYRSVVTVPPAPQGARVRYSAIATDRARTRHTVVSPPTGALSYGVVPSTPSLLITGAIPLERAAALADSGNPVDLWPVQSGLTALPLDAYSSVIVSTYTPLSADMVGGLAAYARASTDSARVLLVLDPTLTANPDAAGLLAILGVTMGGAVDTTNLTVQGLPGDPHATFLAVNYAGRSSPVALLPVRSAPHAEVAGRYATSDLAAIVTNAAAPHVATAVFGFADVAGGPDTLAHVIAQTVRALDSLATSPPRIERLALLPMRPNPTAPPVLVRFAIPGAVEAATPVRLDVFNAAGQRVRTLLDGPAPAGVNGVLWDGLDARGHRAPVGVYLAQLRAGEVVATSRIVLLDR
jgi:subtilisin family serine protease